MAPRTDDSLATLLLTNHLTDTAGEPFGPKGFWDLVEVVGEPGRLLGLGSREVVGLLSDEALADRVLTLLDASTQLAFALERFEAQGFSALTPYDDAYPHRLRERLSGQAPPVLFTAGPVELLTQDAIGIVGSRNVGEAGSEVAEAAARTAVEGGFAVVSGGARGVDQRSMAATYQAGGAVIGFLAESLEKRVTAPDTRRVILEGSVCLATPFRPSAPFSVGSAMARNKLIYASARTTLVVATEEGKGGTWEGAVEALRHRYGHVSVWRGDGEGPGNAALAAKGARPIETVKAILDGPETVAPEHPGSAPAQISLNL
jgi:predicted Rossmann fold nucleotide-binding protein DprA/Smf involved in DNA uptake